VAKDLSPVAES